MKFFKRLILPLFLLTLWQAGAGLGWFNSYLLPPPGKVYATAITLIAKGLLYKHVKASFYRVLLGFLLTCVLAFPLGVIMAVRKNYHDYAEPILEFIRHIPPLALIPLLILWLGIGEPPKLAVIVLASFFPVFQNTLSGIANCDDKLLEVGKVFAFTEREQFWKIMLPQAIPQILVGMKLGLGYSWRSLIGAEIIAASSGIGYMIMDAEHLSRPDIILVGIIALGLLGYVIDFLFLLLSAQILQRQGRNDMLWSE